MLVNAVALWHLKILQALSSFADALRDTISKTSALLLPTFLLFSGGLSHSCIYAEILPKEDEIPLPKYQQLVSESTCSECIQPMASLCPMSGRVGI